jgi:multiple sugar transport system permease protein
MLQNFMNNMFSHLDNAKLTAAAIIMCIAMIIIVGALFIAENKLGRDTEE